MLVVTELHRVLAAPVMNWLDRRYRQRITNDLTKNAAPAT
jgi:hypothetical protein